MKAILTALESKLGASSPSSFYEENVEHNFVCPKCSTDKRKLGVNFQKKVFNCFRCHWSGHLVTLLRELELDLEAFREFTSSPTVNTVEQRTPLPGGIPGFKHIYSYRQSRGEIEQDIVNYCKKRGSMEPRDMEDLHLGVSSQPDLAGRLVIPIREHDTVVNYLGRSIYGWMGPKEISGSLEAGWRPRSEIFFGLNYMRVESHVVLVEGFWDWWALRRTSRAWCPAALLGSHLSPVVCGRLLQLRPRRVTVFMDGDEAGEDGTFQAVTMLLKRKVREVFVARPPKGADPDELDDAKLLETIGNAQPAGLWLMNR